MTSIYNHLIGLVLVLGTFVLGPLPVVGLLLGLASIGYTLGIYLASRNLFTLALVFLSFLATLATAVTTIQYLAFVASHLFR